MFTNVILTTSIPDENEIIKLEEVKSTLENEIRGKINLLKENYSILQAKTSEPGTNKWLKDIDEALPQYLLKKTEELDNKFTNKESKYFNLWKTLSEMNQQQNEALEYLVNDVSKQKAELNRLQEKMRYLDNEKLINTDSEEDTEEYDMTDITNKSNRYFMSIKKKLLDILKFCDENMEDLLRELTNNYFKGGDEQYIDLKPEYIYGLNILREAGLVVLHPTYKNKVKFDKFV